MKRIRSLKLFVLGFLIVFLSGAISSSAQTAPAAVKPTEKPFLWRIEGPVPSYLYGTVHVPDVRVLELPEVVRRALDASDVFSGEIPLDAATQTSLLGKIMLPPGQDLRKLAGEEVFARILRVVEKILGSTAPPGAAEVLGMTMASMKPWAVMSQVELLEFLPDIVAGRQPLDALLYSMASKAGKELGALETVDDQVNVFDGFSNEEQVAMLVEALDELDKTRTSGVSPTQQLIDLYLAGDLDQLAAEANKQTPRDQALNKKMIERVVDDRNTKMATKIAELCAQKPSRSHFFAVGALHYAGETGILNQLTKKGFKIRRLVPADATAFVRKPAA
jgi:uncharacterized protein YbaP (TraB family)